MSSSCNLYFNNYEVLSQTSFVPPEVMAIFREEDRKTYTKKIEGEESEFFEYQNTAKNIKERLEVMGYSLKKVQEDFNRDKNITVQELEECIKEYSVDIMGDTRELRIIKGSTFKAWQNAFIFIQKNKLQVNYWSKNKFKPNTPKLVKYILNGQHDSTYFNYPGGDIYNILRIFLEDCPDDSIIRLDVSDLVNGGYYESSEKICDDTLKNAQQSGTEYEKIIILTEGSTDKFSLDASMSLLFPHLRGYYSFMDFEDSKAMGSSGSLANTVKSFVGSGIKNRVIAIFDNDTAGTSAIQSLAKTKIPANIKIIQYPDIKLGKKYPTIGPTGISLAKINGLASSLEMYFGTDVLKEKGKFIPIQWKGYDQKLSQYQGEIINKSKIQKKFQEKIKRCNKSKKAFNTSDWADMRLLLSSIFTAFHK